MAGIGTVFLYWLAVMILLWAVIGFFVATWGTDASCRAHLLRFLVAFTLVPAVLFAPYVLLARWFRKGSYVPVIAIALPWVLLGVLTVLQTLGCTATILPQTFHVPVWHYAAALALSPIIAAVHLALTAWRRRALQ